MPSESLAPRADRTSYLRASLAFLKQVGEEELKRFPLIGGVVSALEQFSTELADQERDQKIEKLLAIGDHTSSEIEAVRTLSAAMFHYQEQLLVYFREAGLSSEPQAVKSVAMETALIAYRNRVAFEYSYADYRGVKGAGRADIIASLRSDEVYVTPRLAAEGGLGDEQSHEAELIRKLEDQDLSPESRIRFEVEYAELTGKRFRIRGGSSNENPPAPEVIRNNRHLVILGAPGVGKSALVRFLARASALGPDSMRQRLGWSEDVVPVVIPLAGFADARSKNPSLSLRVHLDVCMEERGGQALREAVDGLLAEGRAFVLLDGVDEVPQSSARASVVRAVDRFRTNHESNRVLVTSRPVGYVRVAGDIRHFILPNFSTEQVGDFVHRWQRGQESSLHPSTPDLQKAERDAGEMLREIRSNPKVTELATNPLILVIVSLIRREGRRLPDKRVQLYQRAVETLMDTWNQFRSLSDQSIGGQALPVDRLIRVWGAIAAWSRATRPTGVMHRGELRRELVRILKEMEFDEESPEATAESYLEAASRSAGVLEERGTDIFAFWHPTFEEYLAAVDLTTPTAEAVDRLASHADDPRWREVILLGVGYVGLVQGDGETATKIVRAIMDPHFSTNSLESVLHPRLRLAAACIADDVGVKRSLAQEVIVRLGTVVGELPYEPLKEAFVETVRALPRMRPSNETVSALRPLEKHHSWQVRMEATRLFSNVADSNPEARDLCARLLQDADGDVRCHGALGLARGGVYSETVWTSLDQADTGLADIWPAVLDFFDSAPAPAWVSLRASLSAGDPQTRYDAALLLEKLGRTDEQPVAVLRSLLTTGNPRLRCSASESLERLGRTDEQTVTALRSWLTADNPDVRYRAAKLLVKLGRTDQQVLTALLSLPTAEDSGLRFLDDELVGGLGRTGERTVIALRAGLTAEHWESRIRAASFLVALGHADEPVVTALRSWLTADEPGLRYGAADLLVKLGRADDQVVAVQRSLLTADNAELRYRAAELLATLGRADDQVVAALRSLLKADNTEYRYRAAELLATLGRADDQVVAVLRSLLAADITVLRYRATALLERLGRTDEQVVTALRSWLTADEPVLRYEAAYLLEKLGHADEDAVAALLSALDGTAAGAISACRKLGSKTWPNEQEAESLAAVIRSRAGSPDRAWLFSWVEAKSNAIRQASADSVTP